MVKGLNFLPKVEWSKFWVAVFAIFHFSFSFFLLLLFLVPRKRYFPVLQKKKKITFSNSTKFLISLNFLFTLCSLFIFLVTQSRHLRELSFYPVYHNVTAAQDPPILPSQCCWHLCPSYNLCSHYHHSGTHQVLDKNEFKRSVNAFSKPASPDSEKLSLLPNLSFIETDIIMCVN